MILLAKKGGASTSQEPPQDGSITFGAFVASEPYPVTEAPAFSTVDLACPITNHSAEGVFPFQLWLRLYEDLYQGWDDPFKWADYSIALGLDETRIWQLHGDDPPHTVMFATGMTYEFWLQDSAGNRSNHITIAR